MRVKVSFGGHVLETNPISGFDQFDRRIFLDAGLSFEFFDHPHVIFVLVAVSCDLWWEK